MGSTSRAFPRHAPGKRYELRAFAKTTRGTWTRVKSLTLHNDDPHWMAMEVWRLSRELPHHWRVEVRDMQYGAKLAPIVSYEELLRRAKTPRHGEVRRGGAEKAPGKLYVELGAVSNQDYSDRDRLGWLRIEKRLHPVGSLREASRAATEFIARHSLGAGNWAYGNVVDDRGRVVARVSYNGRVWDPKDREITV